MIQFDKKDPTKHGDMARRLARGEEGVTPHCGFERRWNAKRGEDGVFVITVKEGDVTYECLLHGDDAIISLLRALRCYYKKGKFDELLAEALSIGPG